MRSAKSTLSQERDGDGVNKVNLERARKWACSESPCGPGNRDSGLTPQSAIICCMKGHLNILHQFLVFYIYTMKECEHIPVCLVFWLVFHPGRCRSDIRTFKKRASYNCYNRENKTEKKSLFFSTQKEKKKITQVKGEVCQIPKECISHILYRGRPDGGVWSERLKRKQRITVFLV